MIINGTIEEPYNKNPSDGPLQILPKTLVKSKLTKKFWQNVQHIYNSTTLINNDNNKTNYKSPKKGIKNNKNNNLNNIKNNINLKNKLNIKRVKTPTMHRNFSTIETNKINIMQFNTNNIYKNELDTLRKTAIKLEKELIRNESIIQSQKEKNKELKDKIYKLTEILKVLI